jgi:hypothetical protein
VQAYFVICAWRVDQMVKPITKETLFMNCLEMDFSTKVELKHWIETHEEKVWTPEIKEELSKAGLVRRTVAQVWNTQKHRVTIVLEYEDESTYKSCQEIISKTVKPKTIKNYSLEMRNNRGVIIFDYRG